MFLSAVFHLGSSIFYFVEMHSVITSCTQDICFFIQGHFVRGTVGELFWVLCNWDPFFLNTFIVYAHVSFPSDICLELSCLLDFSWKFYSQLYELCFLIHTYICDFVPAEVITSAEFHPVHCNTLAYSSSRGSIRLIDLRQSALCDNHSQLCVIFLNLMEFYFPRLKQDTK